MIGLQYALQNNKICLTEKNFMNTEYTNYNSKAWDKWADEGSDWSKPITHEEYENALKGQWGIYLTPCITVPHGWFGELRNKKVLGLASGGGQ